MTITIIDISAHQDPAAINYDLLAANIDGAILRCAYGIWKDTKFETHYAELTKRGVPVGAYLYLIGYKAAADQVIVMRNAIAGKTFKLGLWNDVELESGAIPLTAKNVNDFMTLAEAEFGALGIYAANWCWKTIMGTDYAKYATRKLWCAAYTANVLVPPGWSTWTLWQYTSSGRLPGYNFNLDMSHFNGTDAQYNAWVGKPAPVALTYGQMVKKLWDAHPELH